MGDDVAVSSPYGPPAPRDDQEETSGWGSGVHRLRTTLQIIAAVLVGVALTAVGVVRREPASVAGGLVLAAVGGAAWWARRPGTRHPTWWRAGAALGVLVGLWLLSRGR